MANKGYILLHRSIMDNPLWNSDEPFTRRSAWVDLLLMASHKDTRIMVEKQMIIVKRGQLWRSMSALAIRWRWSWGKIRRYIDFLKNEGMVKVKTTKNGTLLTIVNYEFFQDVRRADDRTDDIADGITDGIHTKNVKECRNNVNKERGREFQ